MLEAGWLLGDACPDFFERSKFSIYFFEALVPYQTVFYFLAF
jgi:hypothetical protein